MTGDDHLIVDKDLAESDTAIEEYRRARHVGGQKETKVSPAVLPSPVRIRSPEGRTDDRPRALWRDHSSIPCLARTP